MPRDILDLIINLEPLLKLPQQVRKDLARDSIEFPSNGNYRAVIFSENRRD